MPPEKNFQYPKGSVWRKWDLQVQTVLDDGYVPLASYCADIKVQNPVGWQKYTTKVGGEANAVLFDSKEYFSDSRILKKDRCVNYVRNFFAFLEVFNPDLECIGITDHNYFDDCLLDTFIEYSKQSHCKVIPGVEISCQGIHILLFFPEKLYGKDTFSAGIHTFLTKAGIDNRLTNGVLTTTTHDIKDVLSDTKKNGGIVIYPHCNSDKGLFQGRTKTDRTHLADIFNHQKMNLLQSQNKQSSGDVADYIKLNANLVAKFCVHISSDSRALRDTGRADKDGNYLWIKADPTFEGLKQIVYESDQRIFVGPQKPQDKKSYFVIDKVRFIDNSADIKFASDPIEINENLTTIIGGKSTGKSLLLYYMAKTIDRHEVQTRSTTTSISTVYDLDQTPGFDFEVTWKDGQRTLLKTPDGSPKAESAERKILYIPQRYLNALSETNIKGRWALNEFVLNVILQDPAINNKYQETMLKIKTIAKSIPSDIGDLFLNREDIRKMEEDLKQAGDEKGIQKYIEELQKQVDDIKAKSGLSEAQLQEYEKLLAREKEINTRITNLEEDKKTLKNLNIELTTHFDSIRSTIEENKDLLNDSQIKTSYATEYKFVETFDASFTQAQTNLVNEIDKKVASEKAELAKITGELTPLLAKVKLQSELQDRADLIKKEQQKLNDIAIKKNNLKTKLATHQKKSETAIESYKAILAEYENLKNEFKKFEDKFGDIALGINVSFNEDVFNAGVVKEYLNRVDLKRAIVEAEWGDEFVYKYDPSKHIANIIKVFEGLTAGTINTLKGKQVKDAVTKLLENYFFLDFRIFFKNDSLDKMSPGKKGLVLLQLLINLSNEEWPILLDQPEDDLDNRSVYEDLVSFLKRKKIQRQIIIVTHNPNLVVGADAEGTIVANQAGQEVGRENRKYRFEYISGALENTFELKTTEESSILFRKGIRQHVCEILEGGKEAFQKREQKYSFPQE